MEVLFVPITCSSAGLKVLLFDWLFKLSSHIIMNLHYGWLPFIIFISISNIRMWTMRALPSQNAGGVFLGDK